MDVYWIWLSQIKYVGPVLQKRLLAIFNDSPKAIYFASQADLERTPRISKRAVDSIMANRDLTGAANVLKRCNEKRIKPLFFSNELYPPYTKNIKESPVVLYYKGHLRKITNAIGVVGSRRCTTYGRIVAEEIGTDLVLHDIPLISGFAKGIDSYAQAACLKQSGYAAIFLAGGVDVCYPPEQQSLYHKTMESGSVFLSQYPPGTQPLPTQFLQRNALISAWSTELVVVEAGEKSGALWTADFARKQGKQIYSVPHPIHISEGKGSNLLLTKGAIPYLGISSLATIRTIKPIQITPPVMEHDPIVKLLSQSPTSISSIANSLNSSESIMMDRLFSLELEGKIIIRGDMVSLL